MEDNGQLYLVALLEYAQQLPSQPFEEEVYILSKSATEKCFHMESLVFPRLWLLGSTCRV